MFMFVIKEWREIVRESKSPYLQNRGGSEGGVSPLACTRVFLIAFSSPWDSGFS